MISTIKIKNQSYSFDLNNPIDISIPISNSENQPIAWFANPPKIEPVRADGFVGSISEGGSVNFNTLSITPHGNGTHTECVGHIIEGDYTINNCLKKFHFLAQLITVDAIKKGKDSVITKEVLKSQLKEFNNNCEALIVRTTPNDTSKCSKNYTDTNFTYFSESAIEYCNALGIQHLLVDLPSIDKEKDDGALLAHKAFWNVPEVIKHKTITEMVYIPNSVIDDVYLLNISVISLESDASPSKPVIYQKHPVK